VSSDRGCRLLAGDARYRRYRCPRPTPPRHQSLRHWPASAPYRVASQSSIHVCQSRGTWNVADIHCR